MSWPFPTRQLAGIAIPDTPLVDAAIKLAREHSNDVTYNHLMRSMLLGVRVAQKLLSSQNFDFEALAVSLILHDLGWDCQGVFISKDKRFEVDGANAARDFLGREAPDWNRHRVQLVWDSIALHTTWTINMFKEAEVRGCGQGVRADFVGPEGLPAGDLTWDEYNAVVKEFPRLDFIDSATAVFCGFCKTKPETTYDNFQSHFGMEYVEGYNMVGYRATDNFKRSKAMMG